MWTHAHTRTLRAAKLKSRSQRAAVLLTVASDNQIHAVRGQSLTAASKQVSVCDFHLP